MTIPKPIRLLVVDDDPEYRDLIVFTLQDLGTPTEIRTASTGPAAWGMLQEYVPDLLVMDLKISGVYGTEICAKLRSSRRWDAMRILVVTSYTTQGVQEMVRGCGADDWLAKTCSTDELRVCAGRLLGGGL